MPGVTISAGYGAGGSAVAPAVAELLGLPLLDRAISSTVAAQLQVTVTEAEEGECKRSIGERFLSLLSPLAGGVLGAGTDAAPVDAASVADEAAAFREQAERIMRTALAGGAVILGRAGAAAFVTEPAVLRVRLFGPADARISQAARLEGVNEATARSRLPEVDQARAQYVRRLYRVDVDDPRLYHLQLDSTALSVLSCAQLIADAYRAYQAS
ncbi:MAG: cytidylate kinase-like family protein [Actinomycetota bacterium]|nr:cytidylate kinase-like family protein [Actinomycetota bacterium]